MGQNDERRLQQLISQNRPVPFEYAGHTYHLNPEPAALYHLQHSITKLARMVDLLELRPSVVFDVGANCGLFAAFVARRVPGVRVFAFEPARDLVPIAEQNCAGLSVSVIGQGVAEEPSIQTLYVNPASQQTNSLHLDAVLAFGAEEDLRTEEVRCTSVDAFVERIGVDSVDVLKVDVQGGEGAVFRGACTTMPGVRQLFVETTWLDLESNTQVIPMALHYGFTHVTVINPVYAGADLLFTRQAVEGADPGSSFAISEDVLRPRWW